MSDPTTERPADEPEDDPRQAIYPNPAATLPNLDYVGNKPPPGAVGIDQRGGARLGPRADDIDDGRTEPDDEDEETEPEALELPATVADLKALARSIKEQNKGGGAAAPVKHYDPELDRWFYGRLLVGKDIDTASAWANDDADPVSQPVANNQAFLKWLVMLCFKDVSEQFWAALADVPASIKGRLVRAARNAAGLGDEVVAEGKATSKPTRRNATG